MSEDAEDAGVVREIYPDDSGPKEYLRAVKTGEFAVHIYLKDDKEWWLAHKPGDSPPGSLNGPWRLWTTYPSGPWELEYHNRELINHHLSELYYVDYDENEAHSVHKARVVPIDEAPEFVRGEMDV